jgi:hypothetical protein
MDYQVTHIIPDGADPGRRIDAIYGPACGLIYEDDAIRQIETGLNSFFTQVGFMRANIYAVRHGIGMKAFLTTSADGFGPNNLCQLPHFG